MSNVISSVRQIGLCIELFYYYFVFCYNQLLFIHQSSLTKEKVHKRIKQIRPMVPTLTERELSILACSIEEIYQKKKVDCMHCLVCIQVARCPVNH